MTYLGLNIKKIRERWKLSQEEFAYLLDATRGMIMQYENRGTKPKNDTLSKLVKLTGISMTMLADSELKEKELPEMDNSTWMTIENYRNDQDSFDEELTDSQVKELMKTSTRARNLLAHGDAELLTFLKSNDAFFKNQYSTFNQQVLTNLTALLNQQKTLEALVKIGLEHTGNIEASQLGVAPAEIHDKINKDVLAAAGMQIDSGVGIPDRG